MQEHSMFLNMSFEDEEGIYEIAMENLLWNTSKDLSIYFAFYKCFQLLSHLTFTTLWIKNNYLATDGRGKDRPDSITEI